ncbi:MAG: hypothetical protein GC168_16020 [Candidatus Hydrogenedens sp.]|nr:hypothetical protein [Candidatus Hydrogenedens sp.]
MRVWILPLLLAMAGAATAVADDEVTVDGAQVPSAEILERYLKARGEAVMGEAHGRYLDGVTPTNLQERQTALRNFFVQQLGGYPERTPLNAQTTGTGTGDGFRYEKIIYESRPGLYVTAALYLPLAPGPYPAVLVPCGHSDNGKAAETYQRACILLARNGIAAFCYDPIGQGERYVYFDADGKPISGGTTLQHTLAGIGCILTGTNMAAYHIWDGIRGLDYLESRPDIDATRLACSGNSGGGTLTSYLMALDERITVAAPSCYLTSFERLLDTIGPQDAEQNIFGQLAFGMGHAEYVFMRAPKPTMMCAAQGDFFDIGGTWDSFRRAKTAFSFLGAPDHLDIAIADDKHGFSKPLREAMVRWMRRWLIGVDAPLEEPEFAILSDAELQCSPEGQVARMDGAVSALDLNIARAEALARAREGKEPLAEARALYGAMRPNARLRDDAAHGGTIENGVRVERRMLRLGHGDSGGERLLNYVVAEPEADAPRGSLLLFPSAGLDEAAAVALAQEGYRVVSADISGTGALAGRENAQAWSGTVGPAWQEYYRAYLCGISMVHLRVEDLLTLAESVRERWGNAPLELRADAELTVPGLHAAALQPEWFSRIVLRGGIPSWESVVKAPRPKGQLNNAIHGVLEHYDLPELAAALPAGMLDWQPAVVPEF